MERRSFLHGAVALPVLASIGASPNLSPEPLYQSPFNAGDPYHFTPSLEKARQLPGTLVNFIVSKEQTDGAYSVIEGKARRGAEPGLHVHEYEDEAFYILDGEMIVTIGSDDYHVKPGDYIFLPRKIPHTSRFLTDTVHILIFISPAGLEEYFWAITAPATNFDVPELTTEPPSPEVIKAMMAANAKYGITSIR